MNINNKKKWLGLIVTLVLGAIVFIAVTIANSKTIIEVYVNPNFKLSDYKFAYVDMRDVPSDCEYGVAPWVYEKVCDHLWDMGFVRDHLPEKLGATKSTDMLVFCDVAKGWGTPRWGHMIYDVEVRYCTKIKIEFQDALSKKVIAKISYN
jgi:hypothetical protein